MIRRATLEDLDPINKLLGTVFASSAKASDLTDPLHIVLVHDDDGSIDGVVAANLVRTLGRWNAYTSRLAVAPAARGRGIATELMVGVSKWLDHWARERNLEILVLGTIRPDRIGSRLAHERAGWRCFADGAEPGWDLYGRFVGIHWPDASIA